MTSTTARTFLLTMWEGGGTIPPELGVARRLIARGHRVHVLADPTVEDDARAAGCGFSSWQRAPHRTTLDPEADLLRDWEVANPLAMLKRIRDVFVAGPAADYAADTAGVMAQIEPDLVLSDFMLFGAMIPGQARGVPVVPIVPNIWSLPTPGGPAIGPGFPLARGVLGRTRDALLLRLADRLFAAGLPALNAARAEFELPPLRHFYDQVLDNPRILVLTSPSFDFASATASRHARYVGPVLDDPSWAQPWEPPWPPKSEVAGRPLVLVAFSSTFQDQAPLLQRVVEALSALPVRAVVTLGQMLGLGEVPGSDNVAVLQSAPHTPLLAEAAAVVTHCGHGSAIKSLSAGVPLVCLPMGRDQNDTAARVTHHEAGLRLKPTATAQEIRAAVSRVLGDERYRRAAAALAARMKAEAEQIDVVAEVEEVLATSPQTAA